MPLSRSINVKISTMPLSICSSRPPRRSRPLVFPPAKPNHCKARQSNLTRPTALGRHVTLVAFGK